MWSTNRLGIRIYLYLCVFIGNSIFTVYFPLIKPGLVQAIKMLVNEMVRGQNAGGHNADGQNAGENCMVGQNTGLFWAG